MENYVVHLCKLAIHGRAIGLGLSAREIKRLMEALSEVDKEISKSEMGNIYMGSNDDDDTTRTIQDLERGLGY